MEKVESIETKKEKVAWVVPGRGFATGLSAGFMVGLHDAEVPNPDIVVAASGGVGHSSYFVVNRPADIFYIWKKKLSTKKMVNLWRIFNGKAIDIDYLVDDILKKNGALNEEIYNSKIHYAIAATNSKTGKVKHFSNKDRINWDFFEVMRASMALPVLYKKVPKINGEGYLDTENSAHPNLNIEHAVNLGATKILVMDTATEDGIADKIYKVWLWGQSKEFKEQYQKDVEKRRDYKVPGNVQVYRLGFNDYKKVVDDVKLSSLDNSKETLESLVDVGREIASGREDLKKFLGKYDHKVQ